MKILYLNPPVMDPTAPYCSLYYLKGYLEKYTNYEVVVKDTNIEWINYMLSQKKIADLLSVRENLINKYENTITLKGKEALHYYKLKDPQLECDWDHLLNSINMLKDQRYFYSIDSYLEATYCLRKWEKLLSSISFPGRYKEFKFSYGLFEARENIEDILSIPSIYELGFYEEYLNEVLNRYILDCKPNIIGISISLKYQIKHSICLARFVRKKFPKIKIIAGGTYIHQIYNQTQKNGELEKLKKLFRLFDFCMVGEGEQATVELLNYLESERENKGLYNIVYDREKDSIFNLEEYQINNLDQIPSPNYDDVNWSLYLSPDKLICYVPSRGCYWGKCSFCDYGLNDDAATTKWREKSIDLVVNDLLQLKRTANIIYFSVDALSPKWILTLSKKLMEMELKISWGAEIRLDYSYTKEEAELMHKGGCISVSIGLESANPEIIEKINKGGKPYNKFEALYNLAQAGIAIFPMTFIGFPGETYEQAIDTVQYLQNNSEIFACIPYPSEFYLEGNSDISQNSWKYNLFFKDKFFNLDIINGWYWAAPGMKLEEKKRLLKAMQHIFYNTYPLVRPFISTDTPHALMYIKKYGRNIIKEIIEKCILFNQNKDTLIAISKLSVATNDLKKICTELNEYALNLYKKKVYPTKSYVEKYLEKRRVRVIPCQESRYEMDLLNTLESWEEYNYSRNTYS